MMAYMPFSIPFPQCSRRDNGNDKGEYGYPCKGRVQSVVFCHESYYHRAEKDARITEGVDYTYNIMYLHSLDARCERDELRDNVGRSHAYQRESKDGGDDVWNEYDKEEPRGH